MRKSVLLVTLLLVVGLSNVSSQIPGSLDNLNIEVEKFEVSQDIIFENETFDIIIVLTNNGSQNFTDVRLVISEQQVSIRGEITSKAQLYSESIDEFNAGSTINISASVESTVGSKNLLLTFVINNVETPVIDMLALQVLAAPVGENQTLLLYIGGTAMFFIIIIGSQWITDFIRRKLR